jgi:uncharacterized protein (DUF433 family)
MATPPADQRTVQVNVRLSAADHEQLADRARTLQSSPGSLAHRYIVEGLAMDQHPCIRFWDRPGGRQAMVAGTRLSVVDVVRTINQNDGSVSEAAEYLSIAPAILDAVVGYYVEHRGEVDQEIARRERIEGEELAHWQARRQAFAG